MPKTLGWRNEGASVIRDRAASGKAKPGHNGGAWASGRSLPPLGLSDYDGPETIRMRKYATGTHVLLEEIGVETGVTPREVVWTKNKTRLYRYRRQDGSGGKRRPVPVLLIYGFVLKPYVLDLVPGNSLVEYLVKEGFDVYLLDFGISVLEDAVLSLEDFVLDYMCGAVQKVLETSGAEEISLFGHSQGGTLCTMYASLFPGGPLKNLVLVATPTEFAPRNPAPSGSGRSRAATAGPSSTPRWCRSCSGTCRRILRVSSSTRWPPCKPAPSVPAPGPSASASTTRRR